MPPDRTVASTACGQMLANQHPLPFAAFFHRPIPGRGLSPPPAGPAPPLSPASPTSGLVDPMEGRGFAWRQFSEV